jgi:hypothetical protein
LTDLIANGLYHPMVMPSSAIRSIDTDFQFTFASIKSSICTRSAVSNAGKALLWVMGELKAHQIQEVKSGYWYLELCPTYLSSIPSVTRWAAGKAWKQIKKYLGWIEVSLSGASSMGAKIRKLKFGQKWGRHILFTTKSKQLLLELARRFRHNGFFERFSGAQNASKVLVGTVATPAKLRTAQGHNSQRTAAVSCPNTKAHKHADNSPSLILWRTGVEAKSGAKCLTCEQTYSVEYCGNKTSLFIPRGMKHTSAQTTVTTKKTTYQHNNNLLSKGSKPIGGLVSTVKASNSYLSAKLFSYIADNTGHTTRSIGHKLRNEPLQILKWSETRSKGAKPTDAARTVQRLYCPDISQGQKHILPTSLCSVSQMKPTEWKETHFGKRPHKWTASRQAWVLFDIDNILGLETNLSPMIKEIETTIKSDSECSGRCAVVQTGPTGLQIWVELREVRFNPEAWFANKEVRGWYSSLGNKLIGIAHSIGCVGGKVDMACFAAGRFGRRPGWRLLPTGDVFRSKLLSTQCERIKIARNHPQS